MKSYDYYLAIVNRSLERLDLPVQPAGLYDPIRYSLSAGGKRLRPVLTLAICDALDRDPLNAIHQAIAVEVFHNFTLLHDDVMDKADVRRGLPTVYRKWDANTAILSGDAMLTLSSQLLQVHAGPNLGQALNLLNASAMGVYEGQQWDMDFENRTDVSTDEYLKMIRLKTGVLLGCACAMGAIMADVNPEMQEKCFSYGENLGMAFQLQDDYLDTFGDEKTFGKAIGGDITNDKKTYLLTRALELASDRITPLLGNSLPAKEKITQVRNIYHELGLEDELHACAEKYVEKALDALAQMQLRPGDDEFFISLAKSSSVRNK